MCQAHYLYETIFGPTIDFEESHSPKTRTSRQHPSAALVLPSAGGNRLRWCLKITKSSNFRAKKKPAEADLSGLKFIFHKIVRRPPRPPRKLPEKRWRCVSRSRRSILRTFENHHLFFSNFRPPPPYAKLFAANSRDPDDRIPPYSREQKLRNISTGKKYERKK